MSGDSWKTLLMPIATLALPYFAYIACLSRASILEVRAATMSQTARAKGLSESTIMFKHVLKGSLTPCGKLSRTGLCEYCDRIHRSGRRTSVSLDGEAVDPVGT